MRIALDTGGGEPSTDVLVTGAVEAVKFARTRGRKLRPVLYGDRELLAKALESKDIDSREIDIVDAPQMIGMDEKPGDVLFGKPGSSIVRAVRDLAEGTVQAFVSMGNTGVVVGACRAFLGRLRWISKPALGIPIPRAGGRGFLLDAGATADPKANHLVQYAAMGEVFAEAIYNIPKPRIGLLNIGTESTKGDLLRQDAYRQFSRSPMRFIGNIEGGDLFSDKADVIVTSGFVGNILIKFIESVPGFLLRQAKDRDLSRAIRELTLDLDYSRYGGATLLGVDGTVVIGHGRSGSEAVAKAMLWAQKMAAKDLKNRLKDRVFKVRRALWLSNPFSRGEGSEDE